MKKIFAIIAIGLAGIFVFNSCGKDKEEVKLSVDFQTELFSKGGGEFYFDIKSNSEWTVTKPAEITWITSITPESGNGDQKITVVIEKNETYQQRTANLTVTAGSTQIKTVTINQEAEIKDEPGNGDFIESLIGRWEVIEIVFTSDQSGNPITYPENYITTIAKVDDNTISITNFNGDNAGGNSGKTGKIVVNATVSEKDETITLVSQELKPAWWTGCKTYVGAYLNDDFEGSMGKDLKPSKVTKNSKDKLTFNLSSGETDPKLIEILGDVGYCVYDVLTSTGELDGWWCVCADVIYTKLDSSSAPATTDSGNSYVPMHRNSYRNLR